MERRHSWVGGELRYFSLFGEFSGGAGGGATSLTGV